MKPRLENHFPKWIVELHSMTSDERLKLADAVLSELAKMKGGQSLVSYLKDEDQCLCYGFSPMMDVFPFDAKPKEGVFEIAWKEPTLLFASNNVVPVIFFVSPAIHSVKASFSGYDETSRGYPSWHRDYALASEKRRREIIENNLKGIAGYRGKKPQSLKKSADKSRAWLTDILQDKRMYEPIGFHATSDYLKAKTFPEESAENITPFWEHKWSSPLTVYRDKRFPVILATNPIIRANRSILSEQNPSESVIGLTG